MLPSPTVIMVRFVLSHMTSEVVVTLSFKKVVTRNMRKESFTMKMHPSLYPLIVFGLAAGLTGYMTLKRSQKQSKDFVPNTILLAQLIEALDALPTPTGLAGLAIALHRNALAEGAQQAIDTENQIAMYFYIEAIREVLEQ